MIHDVVIVVEVEIELTFILSSIVLSPAFFAVGIGAANDQHGAAIVLHLVERLEGNRMIDFPRLESRLDLIDNGIALLVLGRPEWWVGNDGIDGNTGRHQFAGRGIVRRRVKAHFAQGASPLRVQLIGKCCVERSPNQQHAIASGRLQYGGRRRDYCQF